MRKKTLVAVLFAVMTASTLMMGCGSETATEAPAETEAPADVTAPEAPAETEAPADATAPEAPAQN